MKRIIALGIAMTFAACSGGGDNVIKTTDQAADQQAAEVVADTTEPDVTIPEDLFELPPQPDVTEVTEPDGGPACLPGEGCFLDPCTAGNDCLSGLCVDHMGDSVCTVTCVEECPQGWLCQQIGSGPDMNFACVSPFTHLCRPCHTNADCQSATGVEDVCVDYGAAGAFCGAPCTEGSCPVGYACQDATTVAGATLKQCVSDAGVCSCSQKSITLGLSTPCELTNELGTCTGLRICTETGLTACDAPEPLAEECNGLDDDCNGEVDDLSCDDDNECTEDSCDPDTGCIYAPLTGTECGDGDVCTLADHCDNGECVGTQIDCDDDNICTTDTCDPAGGCLYSFNKNGCDDGDPCTVNDTCKQGTCEGFSINCECTKDSDCVPLEDGDVCNGTLVCDTDALPHECVIDAATPIACPAPSGLDAPCLAASCHPVTGECSLVPANEGGACSDANPCTVGESCQEGACTGGVTLNCNDGNLCTDDSCDPDAGCINIPNEVACNDGDACTTGDQCSDGECIGDDTLACDDGNPCTADSCEPQAGCVHMATDGECDDGNACTLVDSCVNGACTGSLAPNCDDNNLCTTDSCSPETGCVHALNDNPCDDEDVCTTGDHCHLGECISSGSLTCNDNNPCTADSCNPATGCLFSPIAGDCDDGNPCSADDTCINGICTATGWVDCNDDNPCTDDSCNPQSGCVHESNNAACDDGNICTLNDICTLGLCQPGPGTLDCDDANPCTDDSCDPQAGCLHTPNVLPCDDNNACTENDLCGGGTCQPGQPIVCDDGDACTTDSCNPLTGCTTTPITPCCGNGQVEGGEQCDDGNDIPDDGCENNCTLSTQTVPGFDGELGPTFDGWLQCEGYFDQAGEQIPTDWGARCIGPAYNKVRMVCGANAGSYRYIDVSKNPFRDGLTAYPETGLIYNANFSGYENHIYADGNHPHNGVSWWGGGAGCGESNKNNTINNGCTWESSNCFGQGISGARHLWLYVAP